MLAPTVLALGSFKEEDIAITLNPQSKRALSPQVEAEIENIWQETVKDAEEKGKLIFNGESFRLDDFQINDGKLSLELSKFSYKVRSSLSKLSERLVLLGEAYYCRGLSIGGFVETTDHKFIFGQRSGKTLTNNNVDFIGGILDPKVINNGYDLFAHNKQEIFEELGVTEDNILSIELVALVLTSATNIILLTRTKLDMSSTEVNHTFENANDKEEMKSLMFVDREELSDFLNSLGEYKVVIAAELDHII